MKIASYRPGVISNMSAFEAMAEIYKYLILTYDWEFTIYKAEEDNFQDELLNVKNIPNIKSKKKLNQYLRTEFAGYDVILGCDPIIYNQGITSSKVAKELGLPHVFDSSVTLMGEYKSIRWKFRKKQVLAALQSSSLIWATTPKVMERFRDFGISDSELSKKVVTLGHPVDLKKFKPIVKKDKSTIEVVCVSRLVMEKGLHYIIYAIAPIIKKKNNVRLKIVGKGEAKDYLLTIIREEGIEENVNLIESVKYSQMPFIYQNADIYITHPLDTTRWEEYFGVANLEAMACETPIITSNSGGLPFVLRNKESRIMVNQRNVAEMTEELEQLINDRTLREWYGKNGRNFVEQHYSIKIIAEKFKFYIEHIERR